MFTKKREDVASLQGVRREALRNLGDLRPGEDGYETALDAAERLSALIVKESPEPLSWNAIIPVVGTIASVLVITDFERLNVITTKAVQFLPKLLK